MNKHTRGPWEIDGDILLTRADPFEIIPFGRINITHAFEESERQANRDLIEAAPDLLEELVSVLEELEKYQMTPHPEGCDGARDYLVKIMNAKHVIAKAKGLNP